MAEISERQKWFRDRVGKAIFRDYNGCDCDGCKDTMLNGVLITNQEHADYIFNYESTYEGGKELYKDQR